jgi:NAD(P)-dependent dehydrogenase (short-subunit alcohol dehydrogenase family)
MQVSVAGKVALVTGASRGIGLATALELASSGAEGVTITSRKAENIEAAVADLVAAGVDPGEDGRAFRLLRHPGQ